MALKSKTGFTSRMTLVLLFVSVAINAVQAKKIFGLVQPHASPRSQVGRVAASFTGVAPDGSSKAIRFDDGRPTVLYYFSPACAWCERNWANVQALADASSDRYRFVAVALESDLKAFVTTRGFQFDVVGGIAPETKAAFGFGGTPHTVVVSAQGRISNEWLGAFDGRNQRSIETFFDLALPGLLPAPEKTR